MPTIHCLQGRLWITLEGDASDVLLQPGETWTRSHAGLTLIEALSDALVEERTANDRVTAERLAPSIKTPLPPLAA